ncbi:unnamed protein product [Caenorhabditis brenneri]
MNFSTVQNLTSEYVTSKPYQDFSGNYIGDVNSYIAGIISIISNFTLIYATSQVKSFTSSVRFSQYSISVLRLIFSLSIMLTCPSIEYESETESLYIIKNGFYLPVFVGESLLTVFIVSIVMSCNGPAVQYLQVAVMLSSSSRQQSKCSISIMPVLVAVPTVILVYFGYVPQFYDVQMSEFFLERLSQQGITSLLIVTVHLTSATVAEGHMNFDMMSQVCTFFILIVMFLSLAITVLCYLSIRNQMVHRRAEIGSATQSTQEQLNTVLLIQFLFPFLTIHIPFYITFILPFFNNQIEFLTDNMLYLCAWCPAINPIIVMIMVKNFNDFPLGDISNYCAAVISIISNILLIIATSQVKCYNRIVRIAMYYMAFWRITFSVTVGLTSPVIKYFSTTKTMFIIKNGFTLPTGIGEVLLVIFIVSIVMFCNAPTVQYLQVTALLKATSKQDANFFIYLIPLTIGIPTVVLVYFGYVPQSPVVPNELIEKMKTQGAATFLTVLMNLNGDIAMSLVCTFFILVVMTISILFAVSCFIRIKLLMKEKFASSTKRSRHHARESTPVSVLDIRKQNVVVSKCGASEKESMINISAS